MSVLKYVSKKVILFRSWRSLSTTRMICDKTSISPPGKNSEDVMKILQDGKNHKVDNLEKRFLVWAGKYKTIHDVPPTVPQETMEKARNKARIKIAIYMMLATAVACVGFIFSGKQAAKRGESVQKANLEWHRQFNEQHKDKK